MQCTHQLYSLSVQLYSLSGTLLLTNKGVVQMSKCKRYQHRHKTAVVWYLQLNVSVQVHGCWQTAGQTWQYGQQWHPFHEPFIAGHHKVTQPSEYACQR